MEIKDKETIKNEIKDHILKREGTYPKWYVGITTDTDRRLIQEHNVSQKNGIWIRRNAETLSKAEEIEKYFTEDLTTDGAPGGGTDDSIYVYAYKKNSDTKP